MNEKFKEQMAVVMAKMEKRKKTYNSDPIIETKNIPTKRRARKMSVAPVVRNEVKTQVIKQKRSRGCGSCGR